jgi:hypothetical protein
MGHQRDRGSGLARVGVGVGVVIGLLAAGCFTTSGASSNAIPMVRLHAEADLSCPGNEIRITQMLGGRFEAVGCGHRAEYLTACEGLQCVVEDPGKSVPWRARPDPPRTP